ncbi:MAG: hypothetical protein LBV07_03395, partial [Syntrophobacterales bacterium]|nr:hypothetical protein [Syntrophobacterales bacterium]
MGSFHRLFSFPRMIRITLLLLFYCFFFAPQAWCGSVSVTASVGADGGVTVTANGTFAACINPNGTTTNSGWVYLYPPNYYTSDCQASGNGSASCFKVYNRSGLHGDNVFTGKVTDCQGTVTDTYTLSLDNTPTVSVTSPIGTVSGPFDIAGTATFTPTLSETKGWIKLFLNGSSTWMPSKTCKTETCSFSYEELTGTKRELTSGEYTVRLEATQSLTASDTSAFTVNNTPTVTVTSPSGTVSGPFNITGTATFKPTLSATKGTIKFYLNNSLLPMASKTCSTETCSFNYEEVKGTKYEMNHGGPYTAKLVAESAWSGSVSDISTFNVDNMPAIAITSPQSGTVSASTAMLSDITGIATFKPTSSATKGTIKLYMNGSLYATTTKTCTTEICSFSYKEVKGQIFNFQAGSNYTIKLEATAGGASASDTKAIEVVADEAEDGKLKICDLASSANVASGDLADSLELFSLTGSGLSLSYSRMEERKGPLGQGWMHSYAARVESGGTNYFLTEGNGSRTTLASKGSNTYMPNGSIFPKLVVVPNQSSTLTFQDGRRYLFDQNGKLQSMADRNGNAAVLTYDNAGLLTQVTDHAGRVITFTHDLDNRIETITDLMGNIHNMTHTDDFLTEVTTTPPGGGSSASHTWSYAYNNEGLLSAKTSPAGHTTLYAYDTLRRVNQVTTPDGKTKTITYPAAGTTTAVRTTTFTDEDGGIWTYIYDVQKGRLQSLTDPLGNVTAYTYDSSKRLTARTDARNNKTTYTYDAAGNVATMTDALNKKTSYLYNALGQVTKITNPLNGITNITYDTLGNLLTTTSPLGNVTTYTYDARGNVTSITDARNKVTAFTYDNYNNLLTVTDATNLTTTFTYDAFGNRLTETDGLGQTTTFTYDTFNRLQSVTDSLNNTTHYAYDDMGNMITLTDAKNRNTAYEYTWKNNISKVTDALNGMTTYAYGAACGSCGGGANTLTSLTDAKGQTTSWHYDLAGRLTKETNPLLKETLFAYDGVGNLTSRTDARNNAVTYAYDAVDRLTQVNYPNQTTAAYTYDALGRMLTAANPHITYTYVYDADSRVTSVTDNRGYGIAYQYDAAGNRTQMTLFPNTPAQRITTYSYDNAGRPAGITSTAGAFTISYDLNGRRQNLIYPHQVTASYTYDHAGQLTGLTHQGPGQLIASFTYSLDAVGNRTAQSG